MDLAAIAVFRAFTAIKLAIPTGLPREGIAESVAAGVVVAGKPARSYRRFDAHPIPQGVAAPGIVRADTIADGCVIAARSILFHTAIAPTWTESAVLRAGLAFFRFWRAHPVSAIGRRAVGPAVEDGCSHALLVPLQFATEGVRSADAVLDGIVVAADATPCVTASSNKGALTAVEGAGFTVLPGVHVTKPVSAAGFTPACLAHTIGHVRTGAIPREVAAPEVGRADHGLAAGIIAARHLLGHAAIAIPTGTAIERAGVA